MIRLELGGSVAFYYVEERSEQSNSTGGWIMGDKGQKDKGNKEKKKKPAHSKSEKRKLKQEKKKNK